MIYIHILFDLALKAKYHRSLRILFKCRVGEIDDIRNEFLKHHNIISGLLSIPMGNAEDQKLI